ncbi:c-type cytochrome [Aliiroseovarius sp. 2305UL8-7]|uniref:c-type cytochrome n=1 Tax=Aliiroseovarius conchicola TaxID=3121637 RepID=UPI003528A118
MFDTMTMTKASAAAIGALLIFMLGNWAADILYTAGESHAGEEHAETAYLIETGGDSHGGEENKEDIIPFTELLASADVAKGEKVWGKCKACHKLEDGANGTGPNLYAIVDRPIASVQGFNYSDALAGLSSESWDIDALNEWLHKPKEFAPGNKMTFSGLKKETDRANLIAYLQTIGG